MDFEDKTALLANAGHSLSVALAGEGIHPIEPAGATRATTIEPGT